MLTELHDLRSGKPSWDDTAWPVPPADPLPAARRDVAVIGAGISGSIIAERLSAEGMSVLLLDRRPPGLGSIAASTAQVMWAMDFPLGELSARIGEAEAGRRWRRVYAAVRNLHERIDVLGIDGRPTACPTVYLEGSTLDAAGLEREAGFHQSADLPSRFLGGEEVSARFDIAPRAAIVSDGGISIDPVRTAHGFLEAARTRGASLCYPRDVIGLADAGSHVDIALADGATLAAGLVVLATGYERPWLFLPDDFRLLSTFVMATAPGQPALPERAMIWEAADPYLYLRSDDQGRIIAGGEDVDFWNQSERDALIGSKAGAISAKVSALLGRDIAVDRAWAATFGTSPDGLPAIGKAANFGRTWLAAGYGGNGIAFSAVAAELLCAELCGESDSDAECFDPYRFRS